VQQVEVDAVIQSTPRNDQRHGCISVINAFLLLKVGVQSVWAL